MNLYASYLKKMDYSVECKYCKKPIEKPHTKACIVCSSDCYYHPKCLDTAIMKATDNKCPNCMNPLIISKNTTTLLKKHKKLLWYSSLHSRSFAIIVYLILLWFGILFVNTLIKAMGNFINVALSDTTNGTHYKKCDSISSLNTYLRCYTSSPITGYDTILCLIIWIVVIILSCVSLLIYIIFQIEYYDNTYNKPRRNKFENSVDSQDVEILVINNKEPMRLSGYTITGSLSSIINRCSDVSEYTSVIEETDTQTENNLLLKSRREQEAKVIEESNNLFF
jgi:hypothetical protein